MAEILIPGNGIALRYGGIDTPAPEGFVSSPLRIVVAVRPVDPRIRVRVILYFKEHKRWFALRATHRTKEEQFFEGIFPDVREGDQVEYSVQVEFERHGETVMLDSSHVSGGIRKLELIKGVPRGNVVASPPLPTESGPGSIPVTPDRPESHMPSTKTDVKSWPNVEENQPEGEMVYQINGKVTCNSRTGVDGLRVLISDKNVGHDIGLTETSTNDKGQYYASFKAAALLQRGKHRPDLQARVFANNVFLGASDIRYDASQYETLDVLLNDEASANLKSEHEVLVNTLASHFQGKLSDLKENGEQQDITYLANKSGWDARAVALAALADQFSARTVTAAGTLAVPQVFFYALFRAGLPANEETLYHTDADTLRTVWKNAAEQGVIPKASDDQISNLVGHFQTLSAKKLLTGPALIGPSSLKEMLTISRLNGDQQAKFAELYAKNRTDMPAFWKTVASTFGQDKANRLQVDGKLGFLTLNNAPLIQKVHETAGSAGVADPLELAQKGYRRAEPWIRQLTSEVPIPHEIPGDKTEIKRANYAGYLAAQVRLSYPTAALAQMVKNGDLPLTGAPDGTSDQVHSFLTEHQGKFEVGMQPVEQYVAQNKLQVAKETIQQVKRLQRVYQITPNDQALSGLMKHGIDAAYHVIRYDKETFVQRFAGDLGGADHAALTYDKSVQVHNAVLNIVLSYLNARTVPAIGVHSPPSVLNPTPANAGDVIAYATLESMFGSMDFCECEHCRSILSPAAYLVDLLLFVDQPNPSAGTQNPQTVLLERRPDIERLPLTCETPTRPFPT